MGVLPAASAHALPLFYRKLMTDLSSPILDFYPTDFELDMNGKRYSWQAVCKLPFIKESRLLSEIVKVEHTLTDEERQRNKLGLDLLFAHKSHPLAKKIFSFHKRHKDHRRLAKAKIKRKINPEVSGGMNGYMYMSDKPACPPEIDPPIDDLAIIMKNKVLSIFYKYPSFHFHIPKPPKGVNMPGKSISKRHAQPAPVLWHERSTTFGRLVSERKRKRNKGYWDSRDSSRNKGYWGSRDSSRHVSQRSSVNANFRRKKESKVYNIGSSKSNGNKKHKVLQANVAVSRN